MKKLLINGLQLSKQFSGVQYYLEYFLRSIEHYPLQDMEVTILIPRSHQSRIKESPMVKLLEAKFNANQRLLRIGYEHLKISELLKKGSFDLYHSPFYLLPFHCPTKSVVTVHDTITMDYPELCNPMTANYFRLLLPRSIQKANKIIAVSNQVKEDIVRHFKIDERKINVVYNGISPSFQPVLDTNSLNRVKQKYSLPAQFFLFVGNIEPKKNLDFLIQSYADFVKIYNFPHDLVIAGRVAWKYRDTLSLIKQVSCKNRIHLLGYVDEFDLPEIYTLASVFTFPSLYEGFGYPVLEAMACGTPVVCSNRGSLPEISGGNCLLVDPENKEELIRALFDLTTNELLNQEITRQGLQWSQNFSMQKNMEQTLKTYKLLS